MKSIKEQIDEHLARDNEIFETEVPSQIKEALLFEQIGKEWWKWCSTGKGSCNIALDLSIDRGLNLAAKLLQHEGITVEILTIIKEDNYLELNIGYSN